jgi:hypothetical protein
MSESSSENMKKGLGISKPFKTVDQGYQGDANHPADNPPKRSVGRPPKTESSFKEVGPTAQDEGASD